MIAEDDGISRLLLKRILIKGFDCEVIEAADGVAAAALLHEGPLPDVLFLDIMMPRKNGIQLLQEIRSDRRFVGLRVVVCTALSDRATVTQAALLNINGYVLKPFVAQKIVDLVLNLTGEASPRSVLEPASSVQVRLGIDQTTYSTLLDMLLQDLREAIAAIRTAMANEDRRTAGIRINAIAGAARNLGAISLIELLTPMEASVYQAPTTQLIGELERLEAEHQRIAAAAEALPWAAAAADESSTAAVAGGVVTAAA